MAHKLVHGGMEEKTNVELVNLFSYVMVRNKGNWSLASQMLHSADRHLLGGRNHKPKLTRGDIIRMMGNIKESAGIMTEDMIAFYE